MDQVSAFRLAVPLTGTGANPYAVDMPIVEVTYAPSVSDETLRNLAAALPHAVSRAVECPEEPFDGCLLPGDVEARYRPRGPYDSAGLEIVVEVRSKWFQSRAENRQQRCHRLCAALDSVIGTTTVGVYLCLPEAAWEQSD